MKHSDKKLKSINDFDKEEIKSHHEQLEINYDQKFAENDQFGPSKTIDEFLHDLRLSLRAIQVPANTLGSPFS